MNRTCKTSGTPSKDQIYIQIMSIEEGEEIETKCIDDIFNNIIAENFPNLEKERDIQVQKVYRTPNHQDQKRNTPRHVIIKTLNIQKKERILKAAKEKRQVAYKGKLIGITADFSTQTLNVRRLWNVIFQTLQEKNL
jgi:hypothetical protein